MQKFPALLFPLRFHKSPLPLFSKEGLKTFEENSPFEKGGLKGDLGVNF
jgi:hypothetical protein